MQPIAEKIAPSERESFCCTRFASATLPFRWHNHPEVELTLITHGHGKRFVGDHMEDYDVGDLVLLGSYLPHSWKTDPAPAGRNRHDAIVLQFLPELVGGEERPELAGIRRLLEASARGLRFSGRRRDEAAERMTRMFALRPLPRLLALFELLDLLSTAAARRALCSVKYQPTRDPQQTLRIDTVLRYINENYRRRITLAEAAETVHLSVSAFGTFFRKATNKTLIGYLNELRVGHACQLLLQTDRTISEIAYASGFGNLSHFNRCFVRLRRMNPRAYRGEFAGRANAQF